MSMVPPERPKQTRERTELVLRGYGVDLQQPALVGVRGYYLNRGKAGLNDIGIYDDAVFVISPETFAAYHFNTDPSSQAQGRAMLQAGKVWRYRKHLHRGVYWALGQADEVVVHRHGTESFKAGERHATYGLCLGNGLWRGHFGINIHKGSNGTTSSLGCQTVPPAQWPSFKELVYDLMDRYEMKTIPYVLAEYQG